MKMLFLLLMFCLVIGCVPNGSSIAVNFNKPNTVTTPSQKFASVSSVQILNNQLVINGNGFTDVENVKVDGTAFSENFSIESKTATKIIANSVRAFSFDVSKVFNVILSDANASATFPIDFSLCNATLNGKGFDCAAPIADKDVLSYDVASGKWKPRAVSGLNYLGAFNASSNPATGPATQPAGAYYIINASGSIAGIPFTTGDWLVSNGSAWQKIDNSTAVLSVFGRNGIVTAQTGDYDLSMLGDISFPTAPVAGKVLKFDGTHWVAGDDLSGGGSGSVNTAEIADGAVTDAKIATLSTSKLTGTISSAQITDGTIVNADINAAAAIDYSKLNIPNTTIPYAKLNIADGDIPAAKISGLPTATLTGLSAGSGAIAAGDTILGAFGKMLTIQGDYVSKSTNTTVLGQITIDPTTGVLNVPNPASLTQATNKGWVENLVDSYGHWAKSGSNISFSGGKVGIGTSTPGTKLEVADSTTSPKIRLNNTRAVADESSSIYFSKNSIDQWMIGNDLSQSGAQNFQIRDQIAGVTRLYVDPNGNVGVGMTNPTATLDVKQVASSMPFRVSKADGTAIMTTDWGGRILMDTAVNSTVPMLTIGDGNFSGRLLVLNGKSTFSGNLIEIKHNSVDQMVVNHLGNLGLGTSSQVGKLEVSGNAWGNYTTSASDSFYPFNAMSQGSSFIEITNANGGFSAPGSYLGLKTSVMNSPIQRAFIGIVGNSGATNYTPSIIFGQQTGPTAYQEKMRISPDGNVGIGTSGPTEKLVVYNGTTTGTYTTTGWMHSSDRRLKHGISSIEDALNKILRLKGVEYIFNSDPENKKQLGFIAQDVEPIFPEVVGTDKKGFKSMVYSNLIAPLVESVKALYARIVGIEEHNQVLDRQVASKADKAVLDEKVRYLSNENEKLKKENSDIKAYLCSKDPSAIICK